MVLAIMPNTGPTICSRIMLENSYCMSKSILQASARSALKVQVRFQHLERAVDQVHLHLGRALVVVGGGEALLDAVEIDGREAVSLSPVRSISFTPLHQGRNFG
jgi:hypothetical protein